MKVWNVKTQIVLDKTKQIWENWGTLDIVAETIEEAIQKAIDHEKAAYSPIKARVTEAKLSVEVDIL